MKHNREITAVNTIIFDIELATKTKRFYMNELVFKIYVGRKTKKNFFLTRCHKAIRIYICSNDLRPKTKDYFSKSNHNSVSIKKNKKTQKKKNRNIQLEIVLF